MLVGGKERGGFDSVSRPWGVANESVCLSSLCTYIEMLICFLSAFVERAVSCDKNVIVFVFQPP